MYSALSWMCKYSAYLVKIPTLSGVTLSDLGCTLPDMQWPLSGWALPGMHWSLFSLGWALRFGVEHIGPVVGALSGLVWALLCQRCALSGLEVPLDWARGYSSMERGTGLALMAELGLFSLEVALLSWNGFFETWHGPNAWHFCELRLFVKNSGLNVLNFQVLL